MRLLLIAVLSIGSAAAQFVTPVPAVMPSWLVPYPGASASNKQMGHGVESSYTVAAPPRDVLSHFRTLFTTAGLPFEPSPLGFGFLVQEAAPECDLSISISRRDPNTAVKVTCSPRLASTERILNEHAQSRAERSRDDPMKKFDSPVYPEPKAPQAALKWPSWLVRTDGAKLTVEKFSGQLRSTYISSPTREGIQYYYAELLRSHGYRVKEGLAAVPEKFGSWVQANADPDSELGRRVSIWIKIKPSGGNFSVELSMQ